MNPRLVSNTENQEEEFENCLKYFVSIVLKVSEMTPILVFHTQSFFVVVVLYQLFPVVVVAPNQNGLTIVAVAISPPTLSTIDIYSQVVIN